MKLIVFVLLGAGIWAMSDSAAARPYANNRPETMSHSRGNIDALAADYADATGTHPPYDPHYDYSCDPYYFCPGNWDPDAGLGFNVGYGYWRSQRHWDHGTWNDRWNRGPQNWRWDHGGRWNDGSRGLWRWHNSGTGRGLHR